MGTIQIGFDEQSSNAYGTPVPVQVYDEQLALVADQIVYLSETVVISVPKAGLYHVRAPMPSGEQVSATVYVPDDPDVAAVTLTATDVSPREHLAWAYAQQSVVKVSGPVQAAEPPAVSIDGFFRIEPPLVQAKGVAVGKWKFTAVDLDITDDPMIGDADARLVRELRVARRGFSGDTDEWFPVYVRQKIQAASTATADQSIVAVPLGDEATVLYVRADTAQRTGGPVRTLVHAARPAAEALLAYLEQGAYGAARRIGEDFAQEAESFLMMKRVDPVAACIAGYFLLRAGRLERQSWMKNLADWFPGMPDGAVIYGTSLLRGEADGAVRAEARQYLLQAAARGIPMYTAGLRFLFDGLRMLAEGAAPAGVDGDAELQQALAQVRFVAAYADWDAQTTTFTLPPATLNSPLVWLNPGG